MSEKKVSFILPTRNVEGNINGLLNSILEQRYEGKREILIMDSSYDDTPKIVSQFPVKLVRVEPVAYNYGLTRNQGARMTDGEIIVFLSTDVEIRDKHWLERLARHFDNTEIAGVYGRQVPRDNATPMEQFFIRTTYPPESHINKLNGDKLANRGMVIFSNTNAAIRRTVWQRIPLPEMLKSEDQEWARRALAAGYCIAYDAKATVYHSHHYTLKSVFQEYFDSGAAMPVVQSCAMINYRLSDFTAEGLKYVAKEFRFLIKNGFYRWLPYACCYDLAKFLGVLLGSREKDLPLAVKKALCKKKNHWDKYDSVIAKTGDTGYF